MCPEFVRGVSEKNLQKRGEFSSGSRLIRCRHVHIRGLFQFRRRQGGLQLLLGKGEIRVHFVDRFSRNGFMGRGELRLLTGVGSLAPSSLRLVGAGGGGRRRWNCAGRSLTDSGWSRRRLSSKY